MANLKASISFGLVSIPVEITSAESPHQDTSFHLLDSKDNARVRYKRVNENTGREVEWEDIVKGIEVEEGKYVIFTEEDLKDLQAESNKNLEIDMFVDQDVISPVLFESPYVLIPSKGGEKAYALLRAALQKAKKYAIVQAVLRNREQLGVIFAEGHALYFDIIRYADELKDVTHLIPAESGKQKATEREVAMALRLIQDMSGTFKPQSYRDSYAEKLQAAIDGKQRKKRSTPAKAAPKTKQKSVDIAELLKQSLKGKVAAPGRAKSKSKAKAKGRRAA